MANKQAIDKTIALMWAVAPAHFSMSTWAENTEDYDALEQPGQQALQSCGTVMCLAGFATAANQPEKPASTYFEASGRESLRLNLHESKNLFRPTSFTAPDGQYIRPIDERDPRRGVAVLLHLRNTDQVDWRAGYPEYFPEFPPLPKRPKNSLWAKIKATIGIP
jgi:hypothetical protein